MPGPNGPAGPPGGNAGPAGGGFTPAPPGGGATPAPPGAGFTPAPPGGGFTPAPPGGGATAAPPGGGFTPAPPGSGATPAPAGDNFTPAPPGGGGASPVPPGGQFTPAPPGAGFTPAPPGGNVTLAAAPNFTPAPPVAGSVPATSSSDTSANFPTEAGQMEPGSAGSTLDPYAGTDMSADPIAGMQEVNPYTNSPAANDPFSSSGPVPAPITGAQASDAGGTGSNPYTDAGTSPDPTGSSPTPDPIAGFSDTGAAASASDSNDAMWPNPIGGMQSTNPSPDTGWVEPYSSLTQPAQGLDPIAGVLNDPAADPTPAAPAGTSAMYPDPIGGMQSTNPNPDTGWVEPYSALTQPLQGLDPIAGVLNDPAADPTPAAPAGTSAMYPDPIGGMQSTPEVVTDEWPSWTEAAELTGTAIDVGGVIAEDVFETAEPLVPILDAAVLMHDLGEVNEPPVQVDWALTLPGVTEENIVGINLMIPQP